MSENNINIQRREGLYGFEFRDVDLRRAEEGERKTYNIKSLWQRSHEIINLAAQGYKGTDIAEILNITPACVSQTLNSDLGKVKLSEVRQDRDNEAKKNLEKIRILTSKALATYHEIFDDESGQVNLKDKKEVADTVVLELSGLRVPTKVQSQSVTTMLTPADIEAFKNRGMKAAASVGIEIEVESKTVEPKGEEFPSVESTNNQNIDDLFNDLVEATL